MAHLSKTYYTPKNFIKLKYLTNGHPRNDVDVSNSIASSRIVSHGANYGHVGGKWTHVGFSLVAADDSRYTIEMTIDEAKKLIEELQKRIGE